VSGWTLGVDFGTSFSVGALLADDMITLMELEGARRVPSTVYLEENGQLVAGNAAQAEAGIYPERVVRTPKEAVGQEVVVIGGQALAPAELVASVLRVFVVEGLRRRGGQRPERIVLTYPARWAENRREVLRDAVQRVPELAGAVRPDDVVLVPEPVGAAAYYAARAGGGVPAGSLVGVYDLGGGTFDTAVLRSSGTGFEVHGPAGGDDEIGGEEFDHRLLQLVGEAIQADDPDVWEQLQESEERRWLREYSLLRDQVRRAKEALSTKATTALYVSATGKDVSITRREFEELIEGDIDRTLRVFDLTFQNAGVSPTDVAAIYLGGGSSRIPLVSNRLQERYGDRVTTWDDPKTVTAAGALEWVRGLANGSSGGRPSGAGTAAAPAPAAPAPAAAPAPGAARSTLPPSTTPGPRLPPEPVPPRRPSETDPTTTGSQTPKVLHPVVPGANEAVVVGDRIYVVDHQRPAVMAFDARSGRELARHELAGPPVTMAATGSGVLVVEWAPIDPTRFSFHVRLLDPDLGLRSVAPLQSAAAPRVVAEGRIAWVLLGQVPTPVGPEVGLPFGELADVAVARIPLDRPSYVIDHVQSLGRAATWAVNVDGVDRSYADQSMPTSSPPTRLAIDRDAGLSIVLGRLASHVRRGRHDQVALWQTLAHVADTGQINHSDIGPPGPWVHQVVQHGGAFHAATARGLDVGLLGPDTRTVLGRPPGSPARWFPTPAGLFAVAVDALRPTRGVRVWLVDGDQVREVLGRPDDALAGALTVGARPLPPLASAHGIWVPLARAGLTQLVHVTPDGEQRTVARLPGQIRPLGVVDDRLYCVQDIPVDPTHVGPPSPNTLVGYVELPPELAAAPVPIVRAGPTPQPAPAIPPPPGAPPLGPPRAAPPPPPGAPGGVVGPPPGSSQPTGWPRS
jgi:actin-like ATPase involved in cell morphogenesis